MQPEVPAWVTVKVLPAIVRVPVLLLVEGDPLQNGGIMQESERLLAIMKDGIFWKAPAGGMSQGRG